MFLALGIVIVVYIVVSSVVVMTLSLPAIEVPTRGMCWPTPAA